jgi:predicted ATPase
LAATGAHEAALATVEDALSEAGRRRTTFDRPELLRLKGTLLASRSPPDERTAYEHLRSAIELARSQGALGWELRAVMSLAREKLARGGSADELQELSATCAKFTEGLQTADLRAARDLLGATFTA